jgi:hypothetical protein
MSMSEPTVETSPLRRLFVPVDIASLVYFRIAFAAIMLWEVSRYLEYGWIREYWIEPKFHFTYFGFGWVKPLPGEGMYYCFYALGGLAVFILLGFCYRVSATLFFLGFTYAFLLEKARYLNHFYLICLISFLMIFVPAHRALSVDAWLRPKIRSRAVPAWTLWILLAQLSIVYFYAGVAKLNWDWLQGEPLGEWLSHRYRFRLIVQWINEPYGEQWLVYLFAYGGLLVDLLIAPCLLWRRTRPYAFAMAVAFHLLNTRLFNIGIFPWLMIAATALYFPPEWPRRVLQRLKRIVRGQSSQVAGGQFSPREFPTIHGRQRLIAGLLGAYLVVQLLVPLRHWLYHGNVSWTEEGHNFSWQMKLRDKEAQGWFLVRDTVRQRSEVVYPTEHLTSWQASAMLPRPDMVLQFSHYLAETRLRPDWPRKEVYAHITASLNGRKSQLLVDPRINLAAQERSLRPASWIVPLTEPLRNGTSWLMTESSR